MMRITVTAPKVASNDRAVEKRKSPKKVVGMYGLHAPVSRSAGIY
jgi:hypothetical protein